MGFNEFFVMATFILMLVDRLFPTALRNGGLFLLNIKLSTWCLIILVGGLGGMVVYQYVMIQMLI